MAYLMEACVLRAWSKADGVSHVHAHFASNPAEVAMLCHEMGGPPYSFTVHGPEEIDRAERLSLNLKIGRAKFVVAISQYCRSQLFRWCRHDDWHKIRIVHCGLDDSYLKRPVTPPGAGRRLVCVGRICEQKGQLILMDAAAALRRQGVDFEMVLVGDGELRREVEELIERHDLSDQVRITGWATTDEVQRELDACRAMILPSFAEGLPVVIMEALAMGRPVIATYIAGIPELVEPGINGWLCPAGSTDALLDAMRQALDGQPEQLESMGRRGAQAVAERHDVARESAKLIRLIQGDAV
jgi:glycosyltransferase involved in cell wall biosynthesis